MVSRSVSSSNCISQILKLHFSYLARLVSQILKYMSRSRSARHKRTPKAETGPSKSRLIKGSAKNYDYEAHLSEQTRSGTAKNYDYEAHLTPATSKNIDAESHFLKTTSDEQSGTAPDSNSRQGHIPSFFNDNNCGDDRADDLGDRICTYYIYT